MEVDHFIENVNKKSEGAWREMYRKYYPALCNYAMKIVKDADQAEDIVQDCFIKIWDSGTQFPDTPSLVGYLYRMIYTRSLNLVRDRGFVQEVYEKWGADFTETQEEQMMEYAVEEDVVNKFYVAVDKLSEQQRSVMFMSMEGYTVKEIALRLGVTENTVKTQKKRAYAFIREELGDGGAVLLFFLFS